MNQSNREEQKRAAFTAEVIAMLQSGKVEVVELTQIDAHLVAFLQWRGGIDLSVEVLPSLKNRRAAA